MNLIDEKIRLSHLEQAIAVGLKAFEEAGAAFAEIRELRLYKASHESFELYCRDRWNLSRVHVNRLIDAAAVIQSLRSTVPIGTALPINEAQARPLIPLAPSQQVEAMTAATALAPSPTAGHIARAATAVRAKPRSLEAGTRVTVLAEESPHYGQTVQVVASKGVVVQALASTGETAAFLSNELAIEGATAAVKQSGSAQNKADHMQAIEAELQVLQIRTELLERKLVEAIELLKPLQERKDVMSWINEVDRLVA